MIHFIVWLWFVLFSFPITFPLFFSIWDSLYVRKGFVRFWRIIFELTTIRFSSSERGTIIWRVWRRFSGLQVCLVFSIFPPPPLHHFSIGNLVFYSSMESLQCSLVSVSNFFFILSFSSSRSASSQIPAVLDVRIFFRSIYIYISCRCVYLKMSPSCWYYRLHSCILFLSFAASNFPPHDTWRWWWFAIGFVWLSRSWINEFVVWDPWGFACKLRNTTWSWRRSSIRKWCCFCRI